jgi:uncharacterized protein (DUF58 family)
MPGAWFTPDFLVRLESLALAVRRQARGSLLARRRTKQLGAGVEFAEHRPYTATEDYRHLDWNLYARHGTLQVKRFQEEQDLQVYVLVDVSRSMAVGRPPKFDLARQLATALAYVGLAGLDRVAAFAFDDDLGESFPPVRGKDCILALVDYLDRLAPDGGPTDLNKALGKLAQQAPRRGLAVVVSDWYDRAGFVAGLDRLRHQEFDVEVVQVIDPDEADPPLRGDVELLDVERHDRRVATVTEAARRRYCELFARHQSDLRAYCRRHGYACLQAATGTPFDVLVRRLLEEG